MLRKRCFHVRGKDVMIKFCSRWQVLFKIHVLKNSAKFIGKHLCWSIFLIKLKKKTDPNKGGFPWNFVNLYIFFTEHLRWLVIEGVCEETSLVKVLQSCYFNMFGINHRCFKKMFIKKNNEPRLLKRLSFFLLIIKLKVS